MLLLITVTLIVCDLFSTSLLVNCDLGALESKIVNSNDRGTIDSVNCNTERPVIGILSIPSWDDEHKVEINSSSYIVASYVKLIESAGARVIPVLVGGHPEYYENLVNITNGILFTGGGLNLTTSEYTRSAVHIWNYVNEINSRGDYYPLFGVCLGFELIAYIANNLTWPLTRCSSWDKPMNLNFTLNSDELKSSTKLFNKADESIIKVNN